MKKKKTIEALKYIFNKKIFLSKSSFADYTMFLINTLIMIFLSPILISQLAIANIIFELLHLQSMIIPLEVSVSLIWTLPILFTLTYFIFDDFTKYITHALMHKIPILWEIHKTHHSARTLTPITVFRTHPIEGVIFILRSSLTQGIIIAIFYFIYGDNINLVTIVGANIFSFWFHLFGSNLRHSHIRINYWPWLEKILISPAQHQIHHSTKKLHFDKNFGVTFAIWDFFFGSLYLSNKDEQINFGISDKIKSNENNILYLYISPFLGMYKIITNYFLIKYQSNKLKKNNN
ncbi:sterol desaturase family protein [Alphaproteobacteria bacterium]|nr:sterol desaturase family protein [Alphaproteobacteria bacterium]